MGQDPTYHSLNRYAHSQLDLILTDDAPQVTGLAHLNPLSPSLQAHDILQFSYLVRRKSPTPPKLRGKINYAELAAHLQNVSWNIHRVKVSNSCVTLSPPSITKLWNLTQPRRRLSNGFQVPNLPHNDKTPCMDIGQTYRLPSRYGQLQKPRS